MFSRCIFVLVTSTVLAASPATAQTPTPDPARRFPLPTYDENWQFLSDPNRHADPWDIAWRAQHDESGNVALASRSETGYV